MCDRTFSLGFCLGQFHGSQTLEFKCPLCRPQVLRAQCKRSAMQNPSRGIGSYAVRLNAVIRTDHAYRISLVSQARYAMPGTTVRSAALANYSERRQKPLGHRP